jgi:hypothetical protein
LLVGGDGLFTGLLVGGSVTGLVGGVGLLPLLGGSKRKTPTPQPSSLVEKKPPSLVRTINSEADSSTLFTLTSL